jgi:serine/threonine protein kinase
MTRTEQRTRSGGAVARRGAVAAELPRPVGRWEAVDLAAEGSWSRIYRARPLGSPPDRPAAYALKMLRSEHQDDAWAISLLAREALAGGSISSPHLIPVLEARVARPPRFIVMPWLDGATLQESLVAGEQMDVPAAFWIARQVAEALDALDAGGWMHGDVKPSNIFLSPEGHATLLDLGFARRRGECDMAADRCVMGTYNYLAPESLVSAANADIRSDIYSLGAVLFQLLSGRLPYEGPSIAELAVQHRQGGQPNLLKLVPHLPTEAAWLVRRMMAKDVLRRPQTPRELIGQLIALEIATFSERALA